MFRLLICLSLVPVALPAARSADAPATSERNPVVKGNTQFAIDLYQQLRSQDGNLFLSPYSMSSALAMTYAGARGKTADEMAKTLHFDLANDKLHPAFGALAKEINGDAKAKRGYQLSTANALWGQKAYPFVPAFLKLTKDSYGAGLHEVDFFGATEAARKAINEWVEKETKEKIKDLLKPGILTKDTRLVLTNAVYFKGDWVSQFKKDRTKDGAFRVGPGKHVQVPMMYQEGSFNHFKGDTFQAVELPYVGKDMAMVVLLPDKTDGLADLEKNLTSSNLTSWLAKMEAAAVQVTLPKFKVSSEFSLKDPLSAMGMPTAFEETADFSGITTKAELHIQAVVHKAFVDVSEEGTEAAAATAVVTNEESEDEVYAFRADHPFLFLIRDTRSGSILFLGRLVEPK